MKPEHVQFTFRPIDQNSWDSAVVRKNRESRFKVNWEQNMDELRRELAKINVGKAIIQLDLNESEIRRDGLPRSAAKPSSSRVVLSFEHPKAGALSYPCWTYIGWKNNVRAIVKTLAALRDMQRHGAVLSNQQYRGWKQLPAGQMALGRFASVEAAARKLVDLAEYEGDERIAQMCVDVVRDPEYLIAAHHKASKIWHPDKTGETKTQEEINAAVDFIKKHK